MATRPTVLFDRLATLGIRVDPAASAARRVCPIEDGGRFSTPSVRVPHGALEGDNGVGKAARS